MQVAGLQDDVGNEWDCLLQHVELESHTLETKEHKKKHLDNVRQCCIELLALNVRIRKCGACYKECSQAHCFN